MIKMIPPPTKVDEKFQPNVRLFLLELRTSILNITIDELCYYLGWKNEKYYQQIVNGYKDKNGQIKYKQPTINYLFTGLNFAMNNFKIFNDNKQNIDILVKKYLLKY